MRMVVTVLRKTGRAIQLLLDQDAGEDVAPSPPERPPKSLE